MTKQFNLIRLKAQQFSFFCFLLFTVSSLQAAELSSARADQLQQISGVGSALAQAIVQQQVLAPFTSWQDLMTRVKGLGDKTAWSLTRAGYTIFGQPYSGAFVQGSAAGAKVKIVPAANGSATSAPFAPAKPGILAKPITTDKAKPAAAGQKTNQK